MALDDSSSFKSGKFKGFWAGVVALLVGRLLPKPVGSIPVITS